MADHFDDDPAAQVRREIKDEIYRDAGLSPAAQAAAMRPAAELGEADRQAAIDQQRRSEIEAEEEERRRAGRGGGGSNPANASHSLNIRPDVVEGPAGLEVRTSMKSADYRANPDLQADLAETERGVSQPRLTLDAIARDPWNAVEMLLPLNADEALLKAARSAAEYCAEGEHELMVAVKEGRYLPPEWSSGAGIEPDAHEYNEARWLQAEDRVVLINKRLDQMEEHSVYAEGARAADAGRSDAERGSPDDEVLSPDQLRQRTNEETVKQQEAERPASCSEDVPGDPAPPATPSLADELRAAEKAASTDREAEGQESATHHHGEGKTPGGGGGRGMF